MNNKDTPGQARQFLPVASVLSLTLGELVGLSQYLLSCLGDNWHLAVTATAVGGKKQHTGKRLGLVFIC